MLEMPWQKMCVVRYSCIWNSRQISTVDKRTAVAIGVNDDLYHPAVPLHRLYPLWPYSYAVYCKVGVARCHLCGAECVDKTSTYLRPVKINVLFLIGKKKEKRCVKEGLKKKGFYEYNRSCIQWADWNCIRIQLVYLNWLQIVMCEN